MSLLEHSGKQVVPLWVNGQAKQPLEPSRFTPVVNAASDKIVHYAQGASVDDAIGAAEAALAAFPSWSRTSHTERRRILFRVAELIEQRAEQLSAMQEQETSCTASFAGFLPRLAGQVIRETAGQIVAATTGEVPPMEGPGHAFTVREPVGPALIIAPWNSPTVLGPRGIAAALAAGCTVVFKASEMCPATYAMLVQIFHDAGLPPGCLNQVQASRDDAPAVTEALVAHRAIRKIEFVGSAAVGRAIGQLAAKHLKPVLMELGGKGPAVVLEDANLAQAAKLCAFGAFVHHGQVCFSTERIIVVSAVADDFCRLLKDEVARNWSAGGRGYNAVGSAASKAFADKAHAMVEAAVRNGAEFLVGDNAFTGAAQTGLAPTIVTGVKKGDALWDNESFGPSASLFVVRDADEAVALANDSAYGLSAAVWTENTMHALDLARRLEYGQVHVNSTTVNDPATLPVSGTKASGWGDNNSRYGIGEWLINKTVTLHRSDEPVAFGV